MASSWVKVIQKRIADIEGSLDVRRQAIARGNLPEEWRKEHTLEIVKLETRRDELEILLYRMGKL